MQNSGFTLGRALRAAFGLALAFAALLAGMHDLRAAARNPVVVELFTSQGCSSCPPADAFLAELTRHDNVLPLTLAVDYWDYLGWKDTLASPRNTMRQRRYALSLGTRQVYTPQMVIDGRIPEVGSDKSGVLSAIDERTASDTERLDVTVFDEGDDIVIEIAGGDMAMAPEGATIWLVQYDDVVEVAIQRGENQGRQIAYHNVVRDMMPIGMWHGDSVRYALPRAELSRDGYEGCAVIVQQREGGKIIGAGRIRVVRHTN